MRRTVSASLSISVSEQTQIDLQVAVADRDLVASESLLVATVGRAIDPVELEIAGSGRVHRFEAPPGELEISYVATVDGNSGSQPATSADQVIFVRPSRYAESDRLFAVAQAEFQGVDDPRDLLEAVSSWVGGHLSYIPGSSRPTDGAALIVDAYTSVAEVTEQAEREVRAPTSNGDSWRCPARCADGRWRVRTSTH